MPNLESGLTILELVVVIAIISLLGIVSIPALRSFNNNQQLDNTVLDFKNDLRAAQSKAASSIKCSDNTPSVKWIVHISSATQYQTIPSCDSGGGIIIDDTTISTVNLPPDITIFSTGCTPIGNTYLIFEKQIVTIACSADGSNSINSATIIFKSNKVTTSKNLNINQGGVFSD